MSEFKNKTGWIPVRLEPDIVDGSDIFIQGSKPKPVSANFGWIREFMKSCRESEYRDWVSRTFLR